jgi:hypothetical protein
VRYSRLFKVVIRGGARKATQRKPISRVSYIRISRVGEESIRGFVRSRSTLTEEVSTTESERNRLAERNIRESQLYLSVSRTNCK